MPRKSTRCPWMSPIWFKHSFTVFCFISLYVVRVFFLVYVVVCLFFILTHQHNKENSRLEDHIDWGCSVQMDNCACAWLRYRCNRRNWSARFDVTHAPFFLFDRRTMEKKRRPATCKFVLFPLPRACRSTVQNWSSSTTEHRVRSFSLLANWWCTACSRLVYIRLLTRSFHKYKNWSEK